MYRGILNVVSYLRNSVTDGGGQLGGLTAFSLAFKCLSRPSEGSSSVLPDSLAGEFKGYGLPLPCECLKRLRNPRLTTLERVDKNPLWRGAQLARFTETRWKGKLVKFPVSQVTRAPEL